MNRGFRCIAFCHLVLLIAHCDCWAIQDAESDPQWLNNGSLESWSGEDQPTGWVFPQMLRDAGYQVSSDTEQAFTGERCARLDSTGVNVDGNLFGNLMQSIDAEPLHGKRVRFRAAVRTADLDEQGRAQLWFRVDRATPTGGTAVGAIDNMDDRPIRDGEWKHYEIVGQIANDAQRLNVGLLLLGKGKAWLDEASLEVVPNSTATTGANIFVRNRTPDQTDPQQPFFVPWLLLIPLGLALFALSYSNCGLAQRLGLRFSVVYWLLYCLPNPFNSLIPVYGHALGIRYGDFVDHVVRWTARNVLGIERALVAPNGSGDTTFAYIHVLICFAVAILAALVWSLADWRRTDHPWMKDLLRSYLRYVLAFTMLGYGLAKMGAEFNQFPSPDIDQLSKTYGESSPMNLAWTFMGASRGYTFFAGLGEVVAALFLVWRRTAMLGACVAFGVMLNVMMINFCYDVPVKQYSAHLVLMSLMVILPDAGRIANLFLWNRPVERTNLRPPYTGPRTIWLQRLVKAYAVVYGIGLPLFFAVREELLPSEWPLNPPAIFGSYEVEEFRRNGEPIPPIIGDASRWQMLTLRRLRWAPNGGAGPSDHLLVRMMDRSPIGGLVLLSQDGKTLTFQGGGMGPVPGELAVDVLDDDHLSLTGEIHGATLEVRLRRLKRDDFLLINRGYRWINEFPYNR